MNRNLVRNLVRHAALTAGVGAATLLTLVGVSSAQIVETSYNVGVPACTPDTTPQLCDPPASVTVATSAVLQGRFVVPDHCSPILVHFLVDNGLVFSSPLLGWVGAPPPYDTLPLDTGWVNLGPVSSGLHLLGVQAEGAVAGCNTGALYSWGGLLVVRTSGALVPCEGPEPGVPWRNHGEYVAAVAHAAQGLAAQGLITEQQKGELVSAAARSSCGAR